MPCHLQGVRKAEEVFPVLKKRIVMHLGLLCSHTVDFAGIHFLLDKLSIKNGEVTKMTYRGDGWPGSMAIDRKNGSQTRLPLVGSWHAYWPLFSSFFFTPMRCTMCPDQGAELADLSFGDAWLPELRREKTGTSIVVCRTSAGQTLLDKAMAANVIHLSPVDTEKITQSQFVNLRFKKDDLPSRLSLLHRMGWETPKFKPEPAPSTSFISVLRAFYIYSNIKASSSGHFRSFLKHVPFPLIRLYYGVYKSLCTI